MRARLLAVAGACILALAGCPKGKDKGKAVPTEVEVEWPDGGAHELEPPTQPPGGGPGSSAPPPSRSSGSPG